MSATEPLHQDKPSIKCGHLNMFSGAVLGMSTAANETDAKAAAGGEAKLKAKDFHEADKAKMCTTGCAETSAGGDSQPQANSQLQFAVEDTDAGHVVGFAESHWHRSRQCAGQPQQEALNLPQPAVRALTYNENVEPECGKKRLYAGGVIGFAKDDDQTDARKLAREAVVAKANELVQLYRARQCPAGCKPETIVASDVTLDDASLILTKRIPQATGQPYVSYAVVYWTVTVECPAAGGGGGGGGMFEERERDSRSRSARAR